MIKNNTDETLVCDSCGLCVQQGEAYVEWGLILGSLILHVQCCYHLSNQMRNHLKKRNLEQQPTNPEPKRRRPMVSEPTPNFMKQHKEKEN